MKDILGKRGQPIPSKIDLLDSVFIRGLTLSREENGDISQYHVYEDSDEMVFFYCKFS